MAIAEHTREKFFRSELFLHVGDKFGLFFWGEEMKWFAHE